MENYNKIIISFLAVICLVGLVFLFGSKKEVDNLSNLTSTSSVATTSEVLLNLKSNQTMETDQVNNPVVTLNTSLGAIEIELFADNTPNTVANFIKLAESGFYDGTLFHRVIPDFMIQGGDPLTKSDPANWSIHGTGGPGYKFSDEIKPNNRNSVGTISMANAGPNTNGSQFFINVADNNFLDTKHTVFGKVIKGMEIVEKIVNVKTNENDHPLEDVKIEKVEVR